MVPSQRAESLTNVCLFRRPPWPGVLLLLLAVTAATADKAVGKEAAKEPELITEPRPGQEYVLVSGRNNTDPPGLHKHEGTHKKGKSKTAAIRERIAGYTMAHRHAGCWATDA